MKECRRLLTTIHNHTLPGGQLVVVECAVHSKMPGLFCTSDEFHRWHEAMRTCTVLNDASPEEVKE